MYTVIRTWNPILSWTPEELLDLIQTGMINPGSQAQVLKVNGEDTLVLFDGPEFDETLESYLRKNDPERSLEDAVLRRMKR